VVAEFYVSLARKLKLGTLRPEHEPVIRETFALHLEDEVLHRASLQPRHMEAAGDLANRSPVILRTLDALHLAVAIERQLTLATFDQRMSDAARALGMQVVSEPPDDPEGEEDSGDL